jgi:hypothetical protein
LFTYSDQIVERVVEVRKPHPSATAGQSLLHANVDVPAALRTNRLERERCRGGGRHESEQRGQLLVEVRLLDALAGVEGHLGVAERVVGGWLPQIRGDRHARRPRAPEDVVVVEAETAVDVEMPADLCARLDEDAGVGARRLRHRAGRAVLVLDAHAARQVQRRRDAEDRFAIQQPSRHTESNVEG